MRLATSAILAGLAVLALASAPPPWRARRRPKVRPNRLAAARVAPTDWPAEPATPGHVDEKRFAEALKTLCGWMPPGRATRYAHWTLQYANEFGVDPFLLAALAYRQGRCLPDAEDDVTQGKGLTLIPRIMYAANIRGGKMRFRTDGNTDKQAREVPLGKFPFAEPRLLRPESNLYFAAGILSMWKQQHNVVDDAFDQEPHRHYVSHFLWGDRVKSDRQEDRVLTDRRRLLKYYGAWVEPSALRWNGVRLGCPLDGCPRVISSWLGSERDARHGHRGVDVESLPGEPVRAVADGFVYFAGVDLPGGQKHEQVTSKDGYDAYPRSKLGAGGRYICLRHKTHSSPTLKSCYMHLESVDVVYGQKVRREQAIGTVGRTGMKRSAAHLHLELHTDTLQNPAHVLEGLLIGNPQADPNGGH